MVEEKIDKDGFIVTTQEESVPKEDREFAINVYSNIQGVLDLDVASVRIYKTTKGKTSDESSEARKARMRAVRAHKK